MNNIYAEKRNSRLMWIQPWLVIFSASLFFFYEFIQMNMFNVISDSLMKDFHLTGKSLGYLSSTYLIADTLLLFPAGLILDRFPVRIVIISAMFICASSTVIFGLATHFYIAAAAHFCSGIGNSFCFMSCLLLASRWFPPRKMALITGLIVTFAMLGGFVSQTPMSLLAQAFGWRHAVLLNGMLGFVILSIICIFVQDYPPDADKNTILQAKHKLASLGLWQSILIVIRNSQNWLAGIYTSLLNLPIMLLGALWGVLDLVEAHQFSHTQSSYITSMIFLGTTFGSPILGFYSDRLGLRKKPMIIFALLSLVVMLGIMYVPHLQYSSMVQLYLLLGFITSSQVLSYPLIAESNPKMLTGTALGIASLLIMGGAAIAQPFFGWLLDLRWSHHMINNVPIFNPSDFDRAFLMIPISFLISLIAAFFIKETHCQSFIKE